jgi:hypothetical protein
MYCLSLILATWQVHRLDFSIRTMVHAVLTIAPKLAPGSTEPAMQWVPGFLSPRPETDHSFPSSAEVRMRGAIPLPPPPPRLHGVVLINVLIFFKGTYNPSRNFGLP